MGSSPLSFSNASGKGSDFTICTLNGLPTIPACATLDNVMLTFDISRSGGGSNAEVFITCSGHKLRLYEDFPKNSTKSLSYNLNYSSELGGTLIKRNGSNLTYIDGSTSLGIRGYHDYWLFGASTWTVSNIRITANYTENGHSYTTEISRVPSTCVSYGHVTMACVCGSQTTIQLDIDRNNHEGGTYLFDEYPPDCISTGYTGDTRCNSCGATLSSGSVIPALGHDYQDIVIPPTDYSDGYTAHPCSRCPSSKQYDNFVYRLIVKANNDSYGTVTGSGDYAEGATYSITATPNKGYRFVEWLGYLRDGTQFYWSINPNVTGNKIYYSATLIAYFELDKIQNVYRANTPQDVYQANKNIQVYKGNTKIYG